MPMVPKCVQVWWQVIQTRKKSVLSLRNNRYSNHVKWSATEWNLSANFTPIPWSKASRKTEALHFSRLVYSVSKNNSERVYLSSATKRVFTLLCRFDTRNMWLLVTLCEQLAIKSFGSTNPWTFRSQSQPKPNSVDGKATGKTSRNSRRKPLRLPECRTCVPKSTRWLV